MTFKELKEEFKQEMTWLLISIVNLFNKLKVTSINLFNRFHASKTYENLKRMSFDLLAVFSVALVFYLTPIEYIPYAAKMNLLLLIFTKGILISCGNIHFFIVRHLYYKYINFKTETEWSNNLMIIVMYAIIVWGWARGG